MVGPMTDKGPTFSILLSKLRVASPYERRVAHNDVEAARSGLLFRQFHLARPLLHEPKLTPHRSDSLRLAVEYLGKVKMPNEGELRAGLAFKSGQLAGVRLANVSAFFDDL